MPSGPWGGVAGMLLATAVWSVLCALTFLFARAHQTFDYRGFFRQLLGPFAFLFEISYFAYIIVILAVFGAAAGALGVSVFDWPVVYGTVCLMAGIILFTTFGNTSVERLFKWVSIFLYATYATFLLLALLKFGDKVGPSFSAPARTDGWAAHGITYASYNIVGAVIILPVVRHMTSDRDAILSGLLCGPLAMLPALVFFISMCAFYPQVGAQTLPSDFMLRQLNLPLFQITFQLMIFAALLESGTGSVHAINQRIAAVYHARQGRELPNVVRLTVSSAVLVSAVFIATRFGLVTLIARGYRALSYLILALYVIPLVTLGSGYLIRKARDHD